MKIEGKVILITGAGSGLGAAVAEMVTGAGGRAGGPMGKVLFQKAFQPPLTCAREPAWAMEAPRLRRSLRRPTGRTSS